MWDLEFKAMEADHVLSERISCSAYFIALLANDSRVIVYVVCLNVA